MTGAKRRRMRGAVNNVMLTLTGLSTLLICGLLFFVLGYLFLKGASTLDWAFFTKLPKPVGENGGGMANAIVGGAKMLALATAIGVPLGVPGRRVSRGIWPEGIRVRRAVSDGPAQRCAVDRDRHFRVHGGRPAHASL